MLPPELARVATGEDEVPEAFPLPLAVAVHRFVARTPSILLTVQLEDLCGSRHQPNLPGTTDQYPNWRTRTAVALEALHQSGPFRDLSAAMRQERPAER